MLTEREKWLITMAHNYGYGYYRSEEDFKTDPLGFSWEYLEEMLDRLCPHPNKEVAALNSLLALDGAIIPVYNDEFIEVRTIHNIVKEALND